MIFSGFVYLLFFLRFCFVLFRFVVVVVDFVAVVECSTFDERKKSFDWSLTLAVVVLIVVVICFVITKLGLPSLELHCVQNQPDSIRIRLERHIIMNICNSTFCVISNLPLVAFPLSHSRLYSA